MLQRSSGRNGTVRRDAVPDRRRHGGHEQLCRLSAQGSRRWSHTYLAVYDREIDLSAAGLGRVLQRDVVLVAAAGIPLRVRSAGGAATACTQ